MKKIFAILLASVFIATPVFAEEKNKVYIFEKDEKIYYDSSSFDDQFMVHEDIIPGDSFSDSLVVENGTSKEHDIYLKIESDDNSLKASSLLDYLNMKIYINDSLYYDGKAKGLDYRDKGVDLTDAVLIKHFAAGEKVTMKVDTHLDENYEDIENHDVAHTHWHFYLAENPDEPIPPTPRTNDDFSPWYFVILGVSGALLIAVIVYEIVQHKKDKKK